MIMGYFRTFRICIPKFLNDEFDYIENSLAQLQYPKTIFKKKKEDL